MPPRTSGGRAHAEGGPRPRGQRPTTSTQKRKELVRASTSGHMVLAVHLVGGPTPAPPVSDEQSQTASTPVPPSVPFLGGLEDDTMLSTYRSHFARSLWDSVNRDELKIILPCPHAQMVEPHPNILEHVVKSGLHPLSET